MIMKFSQNVSNTLLHDIKEGLYLTAMNLTRVLTDDLLGMLRNAENAS